jgi:uncharacterized sulfatase
MSPLLRRIHLVLLLLMSGLAFAADAPKPNVLFIMTDDMTATLGCMGDPIAKTPNIDRLARSGVLFTHAYCQQPLCNPSRASMLTGLRPDTLKVYDLQTNFRTNVPRAGTLPQFFRNQGYFSARVGKIFHYGVPRQIGNSGMDDSDSWDWAINPRGRDKDEEDKLKVLTRGTGTTLGFAMAWLQADGTDEEQTDGITVTETIRVIDRYGGNPQKPLWLGAGFFRPHTPWVATKRWFDLYPKDKIKLPENPPADIDDIPPVALKIKPPNYNLSESDLRDCLRGYYASVSFVDDQVGKLIAALEQKNMIDNTIIVFVSDHGFLLGEHGQWQKEMLFEEAARAPLIIVPASGNAIASSNSSTSIRPSLRSQVYRSRAVKPSKAAISRRCSRIRGHRGIIRRSRKRRAMSMARRSWATAFARSAGAIPSGAPTASMAASSTITRTTRANSKTWRTPRPTPQ